MMEMENIALRQFRLLSGTTQPVTLARTGTGFRLRRNGSGLRAAEIRVIPPGTTLIQEVILLKLKVDS